MTAKVWSVKNTGQLVFPLLLDHSTGRGVLRPQSEEGEEEEADNENLLPSQRWHQRW
jgi:hypothetical protein